MLLGSQELGIFSSTNSRLCTLSQLEIFFLDIELQIKFEDKYKGYGLTDKANVLQI